MLRYDNTMLQHLRHRFVVLIFIADNYFYTNMLIFIIENY